MSSQPTLPERPQRPQRLENGTTEGRSSPLRPPRPAAPPAKDKKPYLSPSESCPTLPSRPSTNTSGSYWGTNNISKSQSFDNLATPSVETRKLEDDWSSDDPQRLYDGQFEKLFNVREIGGMKTICGKESIRLGHFYRSATLDYATKTDITKLVKSLNIKTIIDLRRETDIAKSGGSQNIFKTYPEKSSSNSSEKNLIIQKRKRVVVDLISVNYQVETLRALPDKKEFVGKIVKGQFSHLPKYVADQSINDAGLIQVYLNIIDKAHKQLGTVIKIISDPDNLPVLWHCAHGKDRTGIIAALLMAFVGIDDEDIAKDYELTETGLLKMQKLVKKEICIDNHLAQEFTEAKAPVMLYLLRYIKQKYGSIGNFLTICGVTTSYQVQLRQNLCVADYYEDNIKDSLLQQCRADNKDWNYSDDLTRITRNEDSKSNLFSKGGRSISDLAAKKYAKL